MLYFLAIQYPQQKQPVTDPTTIKIKFVIGIECIYYYIFYNSI